jgi:DNA invertase Pin-like site-specific DNA recombinase
MSLTSKPADSDARTYGYCRASTRRQVDSPEVQKQKVRDYAKYHNLGDVTFFVDTSKSGKIPWEERPSGMQMFQYLRPGDHVIIAKLDRAFRRLSDCVLILERFEKMGIKVHICNLLGGAIDLSSPMGRFMIHVLAAFAELERAFISERTKDGLAHKKNNNLRHSRFPGYGFRWEKRKQGGRMIRVRVRDDEERSVMRSIVSWRMQDNPWPWRTIVDHLKTLGIVNKEGRAWTEPRVRRAAREELRLQLQDQRRYNSDAPRPRAEVRQP